MPCWPVRRAAAVPAGRSWKKAWKTNAVAATTIPARASAPRQPQARPSRGSVAAATAPPRGIDVCRMPMPSPRKLWGNQTMMTFVPPGPLTLAKMPVTNSKSARSTKLGAATRRAPPDRCPACRRPALAARPPGRSAGRRRATRAGGPGSSRRSARRPGPARFKSDWKSGTRAGESALRDVGDGRGREADQQQDDPVVADSASLHAPAAQRPAGGGTAHRCCSCPTISPHLLPACLSIPIRV